MYLVCDLSFNKQSNVVHVLVNKTCLPYFFTATLICLLDINSGQKTCLLIFLSPERIKSKDELRTQIIAWNHQKFFKTVKLETDGIWVTLTTCVCTASGSMLANRRTEKEAPDPQQGAAQRWQNTLCRGEIICHGESDSIAG